MTEEAKKPAFMEGTGRLASIARVASATWDWIDARDIDKHVTAQMILGFFMIETVRVVQWGFAFGERWLDMLDRGKVVPGMEVAAVLAAILGPWSLFAGGLIAATTNWYFKARQ